MSETGQRLFLVVYDYGMGGLWGYVKASSEEEILALYPELVVFREDTTFLTEDEKLALRDDPLILSGPPRGLLEVALSDRRLL